MELKFTKCSKLKIAKIETIAKEIKVNNNMNIGIIGQGFVGNAVYNKFKNYYNVLTFDLDKTICNSSFEKINKNTV